VRPYESCYIDQLNTVAVRIWSTSSYKLNSNLRWTIASHLGGREASGNTSSCVALF